MPANLNGAHSPRNPQTAPSLCRTSGGVSKRTARLADFNKNKNKRLSQRAQKLASLLVLKRFLHERVAFQKATNAIEPNPAAGIIRRESENIPKWQPKFGKAHGVNFPKSRNGAVPKMDPKMVPILVWIPSKRSADFYFFCFFAVDPKFVPIFFQTDPIFFSPGSDFGCKPKTIRFLLKKNRIHFWIPLGQNWIRVGQFLDPPWAKLEPFLAPFLEPRNFNFLGTFILCAFPILGSIFGPPFGKIGTALVVLWIWGEVGPPGLTAYVFTFGSHARCR